MSRTRGLRALVVRRLVAAVGGLAVLAPMVLAGTAPAGAAGSLSMLGADVSTLQRSNDLGQPFYDETGARRDALDSLKSHGVNYARLRVWNNPASGYNNADKVLAYARTRTASARA